MEFDFKSIETTATTALTANIRLFSKNFESEAENLIFS
jgi:hypothetical protein